MWLTFFTASLLYIALVSVPGVIAIWRMRLPVYVKLSVSPMVSFLFYTIVSTVLFLFKVQSNWMVIGSCALIMGLVLNGVTSLLLSKRTARVESSESNRFFNMLLPIIYCVVSTLVATYLFAGALDGPDSFIPLFDNAAHLSLTQSFVDTGFFSPVFNTPNPDAGTYGFYPAMLHASSALLAGAMGISASMAMNCALFSFLALMFPLGAYMLIHALFPNNRFVSLSGAIVVLAFGAFPWGFFVWGPLYPNFCSYALVPGFVFVFISLFEDGINVVERALRAFLVASGIVAMSVTQPNAAFVAGVILIPYCVKKLYQADLLGRQYRFVAPVAFLVLVAAIWSALYFMPFMQSVVGYHWDAMYTPQQALVSVLNLSFADLDPQVLLGLLVAIGVVRALVGPSESRWLIVSYLLLVIIFVADAGTDGFIKHFLSGFWYTDSHRIAAAIAIVGVPLAALGLGTILQGIVILASRLGSSILPKACVSAVLVMVAALLYAPWNLKIGNIEISSEANMLSRLFASYNNYTANFSVKREELEFCNEVKKTIPEDAAILNNPFDGSAFVYGYNGLKVYLRAMPLLNTNARELAEGTTQGMLYHQLDEYATNPFVRSQIQELGIQYVLQLDSDGLGGSESSFDNNYNEETEYYFEGIQSIDEDTPGFTLVLKEGDMALYKVDQL